MSLQKRPDSSFCLHPETWSLPSGSHFSRHSRHPSRLDLDSFEDAAERRRCQIWASSPCLTLSFAAVQPLIQRNYLCRETLDPSGVREHVIELNHQHSAHTGLCADSLLPVASNWKGRKKDEHSWGGRAHMLHEFWEESEEELWNMLCCICRQMAHHSSVTLLQRLSV